MSDGPEDIYVEARYFVMVERKHGPDDRFSAVMDFGPGKQGITLPKEAYQNGILGFASREGAEELARKAKLYIADLKAKPKKKRNGSSKSW